MFNLTKLLLPILVLFFVLSAVVNAAPVAIAEPEPEAVKGKREIIQAPGWKRLAPGWRREPEPVPEAQRNNAKGWKREFVGDKDW